MEPIMKDDTTKFISVAQGVSDCYTPGKIEENIRASFTKDVIFKVTLASFLRENPEATPSCIAEFKESCINARIIQCQKSLSGCP